MTKNTIIKYAFIHAIGATAYIALVATFISNVGRILGDQPDNKTLGSIAFLLTFVISAATMGMIVFARPIMWYLDGLKKEALSLAIYTIAALVLIAIITFLSLIVLKK